MHAARFPIHCHSSGIDFTVSPVDRKLIEQFAGVAFTETANNAVLVGGSGTRKARLTAPAIAGIAAHGKRVQFYSTVGLVNALEHEKAHGKAGRIAAGLLWIDLVIQANSDT